MTDFTTFTQLAEDTLSKMRSFDVNSKTTIQYFAFCIKQLKTIMTRHNVIFDKELAMAWLYTFKVKSLNDFKSKQGRYLSYRRTILMLDDNFHGNLNTWKVYTSIHMQYPKTIQYLEILKSYLLYLEEKDYATATIYYKLHCARNIFLYLESIKISNLKQCTHKVLANYFASEHFMNRKPSGVHAEITRAKHFLIYLEDNGFVDSKNLHFVPPALHVIDRHIITVLTDDMVDTLLKDFPRFPANLRDKAVYLLALHCGLRTSDIVELKFSSIDWDNKLVHIIQKKTGIPLDIPADDETLNAIIKYILHERRACSLDYIFISSVGYVRKLVGRTFHTFNRFKTASFTNEPAQYRLHIMRRTFASRLLKSGSSLSVISSALGQIDKNCVNKYLSTDEIDMKRCALEIVDFPYKGGRF